MSAAAMDLIEIFDGEGAFVFGIYVIPLIDLWEACLYFTCRQVRRCGLGSPRSQDAQIAGVMLATEELRQYPAQLNSMIQTIANDVTVSAAFSDTVEMAQYLATEACKVTYAPYVSAAGQIMKDLGRHAG
ncbi:hypothetical protein BD769DRAFT_1382910 [Suillus cothurnatus]|nr:hypothetical protein BD769DRAFT_1382910 [Suillus cothurnatus]